MFIRMAVWLIALPAGLWAQAGGIEGTWQGTLQSGGVSLRLGLHVSRNSSGLLTATLDSIDQGATGLPIKETTFIDGTLRLEMPDFHAHFEGKLNPAATEITGTFTQGTSVPVTFKRVDKVDTISRPQNPKPPYPYESVDVEYENKTGIRFGATLTEPRGQGPFPAAVMITGSGPQDRDETVFSHKPFWVIADYLTRRGIAVLRIDDRGVGKSTGDSRHETLDDMVGDVLTAVDFLKARKEIDPKRIGVIGHSEGGVVGPAAAARSADIAFVVMLAGTGVTGEQVLYRQAELIIRASGGGDDAVAKNHAIQKMIFDVMRTEKNDAAALAKMRAGWEKMKAAIPEDQRKQLNAGDEAMEAQFQQMLMPEMQSFLLYGPAEALKKVKVPVLALVGARDIQVDPAQNLPAIREALAAGNNPDYSTIEIPGLNHLFQKCNRCTVDEYSKLDETFSPEALKIMGDWIVRHTDAKTAAK